MSYLIGFAAGMAVTWLGLKLADIRAKRSEERASEALSARVKPMSGGGPRPTQPR